MKYLKIFQSLFFIVLSIFLLFPINCYAQVDTTRRVEIIKNGVNLGIQNVPFTLNVNLGDTISLKAVIPQGYTVVWQGDLVGSANPLSFVVDAPKNITVRYESVAPYAVVIRNASFIDKKTFEFEIWARNVQNLLAYQISLNFDQRIIAGGQLIFEYVGITYDKLKEANMTPRNVAVREGDGYKELSFSSNFSSVPEGVTFPEHENGAAIGKFRLRNTVDFGLFNIDLRFDFNDAIKTITPTQLTGFTDLTVPSYFYNLKDREIKVPIKIQ
ncbi:MAG: hypothetical protein M0R03_11435 [Novosphingobium sp.]|nr:hypothetical protein [Novosphingobium sp.]